MIEENPEKTKGAKIFKKQKIKWRRWEVKMSISLHTCGRFLSLEQVISVNYWTKLKFKLLGEPLWGDVKEIVTKFFDWPNFTQAPEPSPGPICRLLYIIQFSQESC